MTLRVVPDPEEPGGGFGYLVLEAVNSTEPTVDVQVFDTYSDRWLGASEGDGPITIGDGNWQAEAYAFGPYPMQDKGGALWIRIGPEIVNKIAEYTPLRISVAGQSVDVIWPDDVLPRTAPALVGEIRSSVVNRPIAEQRAKVVAEIDELVSPTEEPALEPVIATQTSSGQWIIWCILLALLAAVAVYFLWLEQEKTESTGIAYEPDDEAADVDPCSFAVLDQITGGFQKTEVALRDCGARISASDSLRLLENGVDAGSPEALLLFGKLNDAQQVDATFETTIGLSFDDEPATAAEYYARAKTAGSPEAENLLIVICQRLSTLTSTLAKGAYNDYCPQP
ncbi:MAG: hypothetical protein ABJI96_20825 [Paracoccaceae bacterium]